MITDMRLLIAVENFWDHHDNCVLCRFGQKLCPSGETLNEFAAKLRDESSLASAALCRVGEALSAEVARARGATEEEQ